MICKLKEKLAKLSKSVTASVVFVLIAGAPVLADATQEAVEKQPVDGGKAQTNVESTWQESDFDVSAVATKAVEAAKSQDEPVQIAQVDTTIAAQEEAVIAKPVAKGSEFVFPEIKFTGDISDYLKLLSASSKKNIVPSRLVKGQVSVNIYNVTTKQALDAILGPNGFASQKEGPFIYVYTKKELADIIIAQRKVETKVFKLNYVSSKDAETFITPILSDVGQITTSPETGKSGEESGEAWAGANCLGVVDYPEVLEVIAKTLKGIDTRPAQVIIEATILVAKLSDANKFGVDFEILADADFQSLNGGLVNPGTAGAVDLSRTGMEFGMTDGSMNFGIVKGNVGFFLEALESVTDVASLGNPKVMTLNRQEGEVRVGRDEGYITSEATATSTSQSVEMLETGTTLRFRPFVMDDGYIRMELHPEDSTGSVVIKGDFALPEKTTTEVTTNILVKDGQTIVIGGLFRENTSLGRSQVPGLGNIPGIGTLFRNYDDQSTREEVIFLITPHVVKEEVDYAAADDVLEMTNHTMDSIRGAMFCLSRDRIADFHYNRAKKMQEAGNDKKALWHTKAAIQFSPILMDAQELQDELKADTIYRANTGSMKSFIHSVIEKE